MVSTHVNDFNLAWKDKFLEAVTEEIKTVLDMSKVENDKFRFTGIYMENVADRIEISMNDYASSLEDVEVREGKSDETLTREEMKVFRKYVGKLNWLAANTRFYLAIDALELAKKQK